MSTATIPSPEVSHQVTIPIGRANLHGELNIPAGARGLVLFAHGSGSGRHSPRNQYVARVIRESCLGTLLFDLLTSNEETQDRLACVLRFDIRLLADRLLSTTEWVSRQHEIAGLRIGLFGSSTGGAAALVAAAELGKTVRAVVSRGGRPDLASPALPLVTAPTLLIVGEYDDFVKHLNEHALVRLTCEKKLAIVPGASHLFEEAGALERVAELATHWFSKHLLFKPTIKEGL